jgi:hypothetical protein
LVGSSSEGIYYLWEGLSTLTSCRVLPDTGEAKVLVERRRREYNTPRPHSRTNLNTGSISGGRSVPSDADAGIVAS